MSVKLKRQGILKSILSERMISNQEQLIQLLKDYNIKVTQATLSRDFADLGVIRTFNELGVRYSINNYDTGNQIAKLIGYEILTVTHNESLIMIRTLAGRAQGVAHHIDRLNQEMIMGTIGGDDTVLVIPNTHKNIPKILTIVEELMNVNPKKEKT